MSNDLMVIWALLIIGVILYIVGRVVRKRVQ